MDILEGIGIGLFGLILGSLTNVLIYRMPRKIEWTWTRSFCPSCEHTLGPLDLVPLVSFALFHGRCRYCAQRISYQYPAVEATTAGLAWFAWLWIAPGGFMDWWKLGWILLLLPIAVGLLVIDWQHMILPDELILGGVILTLLYRLGLVFVRQADLVQFGWIVLGAVVLVLFFWMLILITRGAGMGFGDVKLAFFVGLVAGWPEVFVALFSAFVLGAVFGVGLVMAQKKRLKAEIPFGPFLIIGTGIGMVWGEQLLKIYT